MIYIKSYFARGGDQGGLRQHAQDCLQDRPSHPVPPKADCWLSRGCQEDPQEASGVGGVRPLLAARLHEGPAQPVHEETQSTAAAQQEQVWYSTALASWVIE